MHYSKQLGALALAAVLVGAPSLARSAAMGDTTFATKAAQGGMAEVQMAALAMQRSKNAKVLAFAQRMQTDHSKNNAQLAAIAKSEGRMLPSSIGSDNQGILSRLQGMHGATFDQGYLDVQVDAHQKMLALMQNEAAGGTDPKLRNFAKMTAPVVQQHLTLAKQDLGTKGSMSSMHM